MAAVINTETQHRTDNAMKHILKHLVIGLIALGAIAAQAEEKKAAKCPISGKDADPKCTTKYEGKSYAFCCGKCCKKFVEDRKASIYHRLGGKKAISAAVDAFYKRVLADKKVNHFFEDVNMKRQHNKQKAFLSAALGGPTPWKGKDMRKAHKHLDLTEADFNAIAGHLQAPLEELKVDKKLIGEVMAVAASTKDDVLNRPKK